MDVYSNNCPRCKILIKKLEQKNINFNLIEDDTKIVEVASQHNIQSAPFIILKDGSVLLFGEAIQYINSL